MIKFLISLLVAIIPTVYGVYNLVSANKIRDYKDDEEKEIVNKKINRMRKSGNIFLFVGLYLFYEFYKLNFT